MSILVAVTAASASAAGSTGGSAAGSTPKPMARKKAAANRSHVSPTRNVALSSNSSHRVVDGATHSSVVDEAAHARTTSAAIIELVDAVRNNHP